MAVRCKPRRQPGGNSQNQARPKNLVAVKKSGTPVVASASLTAKTLFLASAHDEFEMLDFTRDWVHVRISGLSRGWIGEITWRWPDSVPENDVAPTAAAVPTAAETFHVSREETAPFPGDWAPLRGMRVKIVSVENNDEQAKDSGGAPAGIRQVGARQRLCRTGAEAAGTGRYRGNL